MSFQINGPTDPEEFAWEVMLSSDQELKPIDEQHAAVYYENGHVALTITAAKAHDAIGTAVPTSLAVSGTNVIIFTVHHRTGNPATGATPFDYPIVEGEGWEGGVSTVQIIGPPDEEQLRTERERREAEQRERQEALEACRVPGLRGRSSRAAGRRLANAGCKLGKVRGGGARGARVIKQDVKAGSVLPAGSSVSVKLG